MQRANLVKSFSRFIRSPPICYTKTGRLTFCLSTTSLSINHAELGSLSPTDFVFQHAFNEGPFHAFKTGRLSGLYRNDSRQEAVVLKLQDLYRRVHSLDSQKTSQSSLTVVDRVGLNGDIKGKTTWFSGIVKMMNNGQRNRNGESKNSRRLTATTEGKVKGLYMYGGVGVGKTMLMDLFVESKPSHVKVKRAHFHDFMLGIHRSLHEEEGKQDPLKFVASKIASCAHVLALDELFVTDVSDAMVITRLFEALWAGGMVLVATSNRKPDDLYLGGLQRDLFLSFIDNLKELCDIHDMESTVDYRKLAHHNKGVYFLGPGKNTFLKQAFEQKNLGFEKTMNSKIALQMGRHMVVPISAGPLCFYTFQELCDRPVGPSDYIGLCQNFHTVFLQNIPIILLDNKSAAYRFVSLIDILYDNKIRLLCSADGSPAELFQKVVSYADSLTEGFTEDMVVDDNLAFAKDRTISRLTEMESMEYLAEHANRHAPELLLALAEKEESTHKQQTIAL